MRQLLTGARIFTGSEMLAGHDLLMEDGMITALPTTASVAATEATRLPPGSLLTAGFIDTQVNGGGGVLFNDDPSDDAIATMVRAHRRFGTTGLLPTLITDSVEKMRAAALAATRAVGQPGSGVLGLHLEGPFISAERRGVHDLTFVRSLQAADETWLAATAQVLRPGRLLLSLAPEAVEDAAIGRLSAAGVIVAGAHSAAGYDRTVTALAAGMRGFTHLFNAMPPIANREPGIATAALMTPGCWCGMIVDGIHVHPAVLQLALAVKPQGCVFLVTDAMPPLGTEDSAFTLYGETIRRQDGRLVTAEGRLAGADLDMAAAVRNCMRLLGLDLAESLRMASLYPAEFLGLEARRGQIAPGFAADLALLDANLQVLGTWIAGQWAAA